MLSWSDIDTIMFDMDGTLLDLHFDSYFWRNLVPQVYSEKHNISVEEAREKILAGYEKIYGSLDWYCLDYWTKKLDLDIGALKTTIAHKIAIRPNALILLQELQLLGKRIILITNAHPISLNIKMKHTGLAVFFHQCISSHSLKLAKENSGFWEKLQSLEPYNPDRTVLFDDSLPVLLITRWLMNHGLNPCVAACVLRLQICPNLIQKKFLLKEFVYILFSLVLVQFYFHYYLLFSRFQKVA